MNILKTILPGVVIIEPQVFGDERGFFLESYQKERYQEAGIPLEFVQDNHSRSGQNVLRGLHFQISKPQGKLVRVTAGEVYDVAADIDPESATFGEYVGVLLSGTNHKQLYVPPGYAHGFCVISETADFQYKCTDYYDPADEGGIIWNDETINIDWPIKEPSLSDKDKVNQTLKAYAESLK
ncbi:MAG: dTDP-4-dehydrorhamnose 3,5-epimerase [Pseudomonadales bacterium]|nr:dTDP-4-dehydrorhamnose 3,5-epimerase [Pseudomonadales bacterium]